MHIRLLTVFACAWLACTQSYAADIYRWVDENGKPQMSDRVPEKYRDTAVRIDSRRFELTPEQQREAELRSSQERERLARAKAERELKKRQLEEAAEPPKSPASANNQAASKSGKSSCNDQWREFWEKSSCYLPYRTVNGGLRPGWEQNCADMQSPAPTCQIPTLP